MPASGARERLVAFVEEVVRPLAHVRQRENALVYVRGLIEHGGRKSLQPTLFRLGRGRGPYESVQQFLADSPWDPGLLVRACAERVAPEIGVLAWVVDDTGIAKDGTHSPGVKRQYSGTLGKIGNCQIAVSVHAVGEREHAAARLGAVSARGVVRRIAERRRQGEDPGRASSFQTKPQLAGVLCEQAAGWEVPQAPILADCAYGDDTAFRTRLHALELEYVLAVSAQTASTGRRRSSPCPSARARSGGGDRSPAPTASPSRCGRSPSGCPARAWQTLPCRTTPAGEDVCEPLRLRPRRRHPPRPQRLPAAARGVADHRVAARAPTRPATTGSPTCSDDEPRERLARLARLRWTIELDYRQLKGELGLDHYEGRSYAGFHHHCALVTCAHAFLTLERLDPKAPRPA